MDFAVAHGPVRQADVAPLREPCQSHRRAFQHRREEPPTSLRYQYAAQPTAPPRRLPLVAHNGYCPRPCRKTETAPVVQYQASDDRRSDQSYGYHVRQ